MRNLIFAINMTIDGCCDHTKFNPDEETLEYFTHLMRDADMLLYGRKTYQLMVPYWPDIAKDHSGDKSRFRICPGICRYRQYCLFTIVRQG